MSGRVRHKKRQSTYSVLGEAEVQSSTPIHEGDSVVVYQADTDGSLWVRPPVEFNDGRFEPVEATVGHTFHYKINGGPEKTINTKSSIYTVAAAACLIDVYNTEIEPGSNRPGHAEGVVIEIWVPKLLPEYGPYFYRARFDENQSIIVYGISRGSRLTRPVK